MKKFLVALSLLLSLTLFSCGEVQETEVESVVEETTEAVTETEEAKYDEDYWEDFSLKNLSEEELANLKVDIYILAGQSNASGSTDIDYSLSKEERDKTSYKNVLYYSHRRTTNGIYASNSLFVSTKEGLGSDTGNIGPELGMAEYLSTQYQTKDHIAVILKVAAGGTSLLNCLPEQDGIPNTNVTKFEERGSWLPSALDPEPEGDYFRPTGFLTRELKTNMQECVDALIEKGCKAENISFEALCWSQGGDDRSDAHRDNYVSYFTLLAAEFRTDATEISGKDCSKMPIIIAELSETFDSAEPDEVLKNQAFIAMQNTIPSAVENTYLIPTSKIAINEMQPSGSVVVGSDHYHWYYTDMLNIGQMFAKKAYEVAKE